MEPPTKEIAAPTEELETSLAQTNNQNKRNEISYTHAFQVNNEDEDTAPTMKVRLRAATNNVSNNATPPTPPGNLRNTLDIVRERKTNYPINRNKSTIHQKIIEKQQAHAHKLKHRVSKTNQFKRKASQTVGQLKDAGKDAVEFVTPSKNQVKSAKRKASQTVGQLKDAGKDAVEFVTPSKNQVKSATNQVKKLGKWASKGTTKLATASAPVVYTGLKEVAKGSLTAGKILTTGIGYGLMGAGEQVVSGVVKGIAKGGRNFILKGGEAGWIEGQRLILPEGQYQRAQKERANAKLKKERNRACEKCFECNRLDALLNAAQPRHSSMNGHELTQYGFNAPRRRIVGRGR